MIVICVVTTRRNSGGSYNPRYLLQSSTAFHALIGEEQIRTGRKDFSLMVCDVDPVQHPEAKKLSSFIPTIRKRLIEPLSINDEKINIKEKESGASSWRTQQESKLYKSFYKEKIR